jgi:eukaryotic-like serine/threonine-protein kinase
MSDEKTPKPETTPERAVETALYTPEEPSTNISDVQVADATTGAAPSFRVPTPSPAPPPGFVPRPPVRRDQRPQALPPGATIDDFEVIRMLGRGAFGHVYLARQISLDREVALKVSANRGSEGRTMARLEHAHIVQVFSEQVDEPTDQRLLCMQLVPGIGLEKIIGSIGMQLELMRTLAPLAAPAISGTKDDAPPWRGSDVLAIIDTSASLPTALDPAALRDREALADMDDVEATAWIGARLAEALDFAHQRGVLHRDIKPANILVSPYGRPMLADFNISSQQVEAEGSEMFGGTIAYMAPEHLDAFNPSDATTEAAVTERADIYSLGLVLNELLHGRPPQASFDRNAGMVDRLRHLADQRREHPPHAAEEVPSARKVLEQTICRCLAPYPQDRFGTGAELAEQLEGCRQLRHAERALPQATGAIVSKVVPSIIARPFLWFVVLVVVPQVIASIVNISYNLSQIGEHLSDPRKEMFMRVVTIYNVVMYPVALALFAWAFFPVRRVWHDMHAAAPLAAGRVAAARQQALQLPLWVAGLSAAGWLPGGILFPAVISARTGILNFETWMHFIASFTLSGLIALAYSLCGSQFVIQRALYPRMWDDVRHFTATARQELAPMASRVVWIQRLAGVALLAAMLVLIFSPDTSWVFRALVGGLIVLGWAGYQLASRVTRSLTDIVLALTAAKS